MLNGDKKDMEAIALYINAELKKGRTQKEIEIIDFKVNERVIEKRLKRNGYKKINNQYIKPGNIIAEQEHTNILNDSNKENDTYINSMTTVIKNDKASNSKDLRKYDNSMTTVIKNKKLEENLIDLLKNYDKLKNIINEYDKRYDKEYDREENKIIVELPLENEKEFRTTIRVNKSIWTQFNNFSDNNKEFTKKDLLSMALKEYMEKYK